MNLLLIEPHKGSRDALTEFLRASGHDVTIATTATRGLEAAREHAYDAVLTALWVPEALPAQELVGKLRRAEPQAILIVTSGTVGCGDILELAHRDDPIAAARAAGADRCMSKPLDVGLLLETIERASCDRI